MNKHHLRAFTILELTITMLLVALVIGITYTIYTIVSRSYESFQYKNEEIAVLDRLNELLSKDFSRSDSIFKTPRGLLFQSKRDTISYELDTGFITRTNTITDTFKVKTQDLNILYQNQSLNDNAPIAGKSRIDEMEFDIWLQNEKIPYHYHKLYSSENLIK